MSKKQHRHPAIKLVEKQNHPLPAPDMPEESHAERQPTGTVVVWLGIIGFIILFLLIIIGLTYFSSHSSQHKPIVVAPVTASPQVQTLPPKVQIAPTLQEKAGNIVEYQQIREPVIKSVTRKIKATNHFTHKQEKATTCDPAIYPCGAWFIRNGKQEKP